MLPHMVNEIVKSNEYKIYNLLTNRSYNSWIFSGVYQRIGIVPCIKVRKNARVRKTSPILRNLFVISLRYNLQQSRIA